MPVPEPKIIRSHRSSISLHITPQGELVVQAPKLIPYFIIKQFIESKETWILKSLEKIKKHTAKTKKFIEGETFMFLGNSYTLKHDKGIEILFKESTVYFPKVMLFRAKKELENWYIKQAKEKITQRVAYHALQMKAEYKSILFSDTSSKWGTCFADNSLQFNWRLIMAPLLVIDYVVIHELAHTKQHNHSQKFWGIVASFTPAYKQHRKWLSEYGHTLTL